MRQRHPKPLVGQLHSFNRDTEPDHLSHIDMGQTPVFHGLARVPLNHPLSEMGQQLVSTLVEMIDKRIYEVPGRYLPIGIRTGATTTKEESRQINQLFGKTP